MERRDLAIALAAWGGQRRHEGVPSGSCCGAVPTKSSGQILREWPRRTGRVALIEASWPPLPTLRRARRAISGAHFRALRRSLSMRRVLEIPQIRRALALAHRHQHAVSAHVIAFGADRDHRIRLDAGALGPAVIGF